MTTPNHYSIDLDIKFGYLNVIDVPALVEANTEQWFNQTLTQVDGNVVKLGIVQGEFHWHHHENEDEFLFVLDGELLIDLDNDTTITLGRHKGLTIPKGKQHRTRAPSKTVMLMSSAVPISQSFDELFAQLAMTRAHYEDLRTSNGSLRARADARSRLHELRSQLAALREGG